MTCTEGAVELAEGRSILSAISKKSVKKVDRVWLNSETERCKEELFEVMTCSEERGIHQHLTTRDM